MKNLVVIRGVSDTGMMIGPCDFFGSLENIRNRYYSCEINESVICFFLHDAVEPVYCAPDLPNVPNRLTVHIDGVWTSHTLPNSTHSIFAKPGVLNFDTTEQRIMLPCFDARGFSLDKFRARLVRNDQPFTFVDVNKPNNFFAFDDLRVISYRFGSSYAQWQSETNGLFLETHKFIQCITPLNDTAAGFVMLACNSYRIIGVQIPFGYSLILAEDCIHGDATLVGYYAMCMTSNHASMATADTVFLKNANHDNILFVNDQADSDVAGQHVHTIQHRNMIYNYPSVPMGAIFNPFARGYWKYLKS
jgi:hypothetical protein